MAHIDHSFQMAQDPAAAQSLFERDVVPELASKADFHVVREHPGRLVFDDALTEEDADATEERPGLGDEEELTDAPPVATDIVADALLNRATSPRAINPGEDLLARHLHVDFSADDSGTLVRVHGHVRRNLRAALELLGTAGHWPEIADRPHD